MDKILYNVPQLSLDFEHIDPYSKVNGLSLQNLFYVKYAKFPNCYMFSTSERENENYFDTIPMLAEIKERLGKNDNMMSVYYTTYDYATKEERVGFNILLKKEGIFARFENSVSESYILYKNDNVDCLGELLDIVNKYYAEPKTEENKVFQIATLPNGGFCLNKLPVKEVEDFDISKQYNDNFKSQAEKIEKFMNEDKSGLVVLHGKKGTGKTTFIKHLININTTRRFIFVPSSMVSVLGSPAFTSFLQSLHDSVIILEDCESVIKSRKSSNSDPTVALLLNMTDGLLSDGLGIKFICTFNENPDSIDEALLRKGRLVSKYEFSELSLDKTNTLLNEIYGENVKSDKGMSLADIYNFEDESYEEKRKKII